MSNKETPTRRKFLKQSATIAGGVSLLGINPLMANTSTTTSNDLQVHIFSKHLQFLDYQEMAKTAKELGFDGVDLTVRPKGHVLPENVERDLPKATEALKEVGFQPNLFTSKLTDANNPLNQKVLETASNLGYQYYRTGYLKYASDSSIPQSMNDYHKELKKLAKLNRKLGLTGGYQNHAGKNYVGAAIWDSHQILEGIATNQMGLQYDIRHATVVGGTNWETAFRLVKDKINSLVVKDFLWKQIDGKWKPVHVPMGEGMVDFKRFFQLVKEYKINVPFSLHVEYDLGGAEKGKSEISIPKEEVLGKIEKDLQFLRAAWANV